MKKATKLFALLLALGMLTFSLFACSGCSDDAGSGGNGGNGGSNPEETLENDNVVDIGDLTEGLGKLK